MDRYEKWRRYDVGPVAPGPAGEAETVLRFAQAEARADEHEVMGRVVIPAPPWSLRRELRRRRKALAFWLRWRLLGPNRLLPEECQRWRARWWRVTFRRQKNR